jgi:hypothetical protein
LLIDIKDWDAVVGLNSEIPLKGALSSQTLMIKGHGMMEKTAFHIQKTGGRYCLVAPSNKPFISLGVNHAGALAEEDPFNLFLSKYEGNWNKATETVIKNFLDWGFNTAGYQSPFELHQHLPFMAEPYPYPAAIAYWLPKADYPDVFDPLWESKIKNTVTLMCALVKQNQRNLIGYYWTDTPRWDLDAARKHVGADWVSSIRSLPTSAPGKQRYLGFLKDRHVGNSSLLDSVYGFFPEATKPCDDKNFSTLRLDHPVVIKDDMEFLRLIARRYYQVAGEATRAADPVRLIFGDRYLGGDHPKEVIEEALPWIDVLSVQPLGIVFEEDLFDELYEISKRPILICDHQSSFHTKEYPDTLWNQLPDEATAAKGYHEYLTAAFKKPYIIGYHRCQYIDRYDKNNRLLKQGLLREDETPYQQMVDEVKRTNQSITKMIHQ